MSKKPHFGNCPLCINKNTTQRIIQCLTFAEDTFSVNILNTLLSKVKNLKEEKTRHRRESDSRGQASTETSKDLSLLSKAIWVIAAQKSACSSQAKFLSRFATARTHFQQMWATFPGKSNMEIGFVFSEQDSENVTLNWTQIPDKNIICLLRIDPVNRTLCTQ